MKEKRAFRWQKLSGNRPSRWRLTLGDRSLTLELQEGKTKVLLQDQEEPLVEGLDWAAAREWAKNWLIQKGRLQPKEG